MPLPSPGSVLIQFISNPTAPAWWGFLLAVLMLATSMIQTLILHQYYHCIFVYALRVRTAIIGVIYRKVSQVRLRGEARPEQLGRRSQA